MLYRVIWEVNLDAPDPFTAATTARQLQRGDSLVVSLFRVSDGHDHHLIDLTAGAQPAPAASGPRATGAPTRPGRRRGRPRAGSGPTRAERIKEVLADEGIDLSTDQILAELDRRGGAPQVKNAIGGVRSVLSQLVRDDPEVRRVSPGRYQYWAPGSHAKSLQESAAVAD